jgi:hypothetical protein
MPDDITPQFFAPDAQGNNQAIYKTIIDNLEALQTSQIKARNRQYKVMPTSTLVLDGIPGIPFERSMPNPDLFYQGEDIVYDMFLFHDGQPVSAKDYDIQVYIKTSPRAQELAWEGSIDNGIYAVPNDSGYYELWIPSSITSGFYAGTYYVNVQIQERVGSGKGRYDRKYVLLQTYFSLDYSNFSPSPEGNGRSPHGLNRAGVEPVWPNTPDTIGKKTPTSQEVFYSAN